MVSTPCAAATTHPRPPSRPPPSPAWPRFGRSNAKNFDTGIGTPINPNGGTLGGQPIVAAGVSTASGTTDLVLIGDNNGTFFALDANTTTPTGSVVWYSSLGTSMAGDPVDKPYGIRSTAALDHTGAGTVYVGDGTQVYGLALTTGAVLPGWPVSTVAAGAPQHRRLHA